MRAKDILITGGLGFIGSHTVVELLEMLEISEGRYSHGPSGPDRPDRIVIIDNLSNSRRGVLDKIRQVVGTEGAEGPKDTKATKLVFEEGDLCDVVFLDKIFQQYRFKGVIHFAGLKAVNESLQYPLKYYRTNLVSTLNLLETMQQHDVKNLIFSSSATVYGTVPESPLKEDCETGRGITNPYGETKHMIEMFLRNLSNSDPSWDLTALRYFNPIGAHPSGKLGEDPLDSPNNLMPWILRAATGSKLTVFGTDYDTEDGTCLRDYVHVVDVARAHIAAMKHWWGRDEKGEGYKGYKVYNLGTGKGTSVSQLIAAFEEANGVNVNWVGGDRREGDLATCYCDPTLIGKDLGWRAEHDIHQMCKDSWRFWSLANPNSN